MDTPYEDLLKQEQDKFLDQKLKRTDTGGRRITSFLGNFMGQEDQNQKVF